METTKTNCKNDIMGAHYVGVKSILMLLQYVMKNAIGDMLIILANGTA